MTDRITAALEQRKSDTRAYWEQPCVESRTLPEGDSGIPTSLRSGAGASGRNPGLSASPSESGLRQLMDADEDLAWWEAEYERVANSPPLRLSGDLEAVQRWREYLQRVKRGRDSLRRQLGVGA